YCYSYGNYSALPLSAECPLQATFRRGLNIKIVSLSFACPALDGSKGNLNVLFFDLAMLAVV
ncbi:MAG: hypothetical protein COY19_10670, partial [Candidatus Marinimicrobia bacterium CG_4_10_14_0_2_um_filter_48_9]